MEDKLQITEDEINNIENFNLPLLQEAMRQAELRIQDENNRKERIDTIAYALLTVFSGLIRYTVYWYQSSSGITYASSTMLNYIATYILNSKSI